jgi:pimeloyl-ACP methyl ester carboxylesterase
MIPAPSGSFEVADGRRLAYDDVGDPEGRPIVYLHGCPDSRLSRHPDDSIAARARVRLIAIDRPGYGASSPPADWTIGSVTRDVLALIEHLELERCAVLGWSSGGPIALSCAHAAPERVAAVGVAAGTVPSDFDGSVDEIAAEMLPFLVPADLTRALALEHIREGKSAAYLADLDSVPGLGDQLAMGVCAATVNGLQGAEFDVRNLVMPWTFDPTMIEAPVLLWYGDEDDVVPASVGGALAQQLPNARFEILERASHLLPLTNWSRLLDSLAQQLDMEEHSCR